MTRTLIHYSPALALLLLAAACGPPQVVEEVVLPPEPEIQDIPGVNPAALSAFNDGIFAMQETPTNYQAALGFFERAFELDPNFWEALDNIGLIQMDLGMYAEAAASFQAELALIDDLISRQWPVNARPEVYLNLGKALSLANRTNDAAQAFGELLQIDPANVEARANLAALNLQSGNSEGARQYIGELLEMSRDDVGALNILALSFKREGNMQMASYLWERALAVIAITQQTLEDEAQYEGLSEDETEQLRSYNTGRLARLVKVQSDINNELGIIAWSDGKEDEAESLFFSSVGLNPSNAAAHLNLATVYLDFADFPTACFHFDEALALRPSDEIGLVGKGSCLYGQGEVDSAFETFETAFQFHGDNAFVAQRLGDISFSDRNDLPTAISWYSRNLELRGLSLNTCDRSTDQVCATLHTAIELQQAAPAAEEAE
jgi:tetratricopeptide (TPR) repeat protein